MNTGFKQDFFDKLDEYEKIKTGKVCFKTTSAMVVAYVITFIVCWGIIGIFEVSPLICLPIGVLWFVQTMLQLYYGCKLK